MTELSLIIILPSNSLIYTLFRNIFFIIGYGKLLILHFLFIPNCHPFVLFPLLLLLFFFFFFFFSSSFPFIFIHHPSPIFLSLLTFSLSFVLGLCQLQSFSCILCCPFTLYSFYRLFVSSIRPLIFSLVSNNPSSLLYSFYLASTLILYRF